MKQVGFLITDGGRDPRYPRRPTLSDYGVTDADQAAGFSSEPVYTLTRREVAILTRKPDAIMLIVGIVLVGLALYGFWSS